MSTTSRMDKENVHASKLSTLFRNDANSSNGSLESMDSSKNISFDGSPKNFHKRLELADNQIEQRLMTERKKAMEVLNAAIAEHQKRNFAAVKNKALASDTPSSTPGLNRTDYVSYKHCDSINISDLISDQTIEVKSLNSPAVTSTRISFEPSEITGRSTMCKAKQPTIEEILSSSVSEHVRQMRDSLYMNTKSLPRTADMSIASSGMTDYQRANENEFTSEHFQAGEDMYSKLVADEVSWEKEFAAIPTEAMNHSKMSASCFSPPTVGKDVSLGGYFSKRSENLLEMIPQKSPPKTETYALVDDSMSTNTANSSVSNSTLPERDLNEKPTINTATFDKPPLLTNKSITDSTVREKHSIEANKDDSYVLSVSAIANALNAIETPDCARGVLSKLLKTKQVKSYMDKSSEPMADITERVNKSLSIKALQESKKLSTQKPMEFQELPSIVRDKENIVPGSQLSDTASFSDSVLDLSEWKQLQATVPTLVAPAPKAQSRSPKNIPSLHFSPPTTPQKHQDEEMENNKPIRKSTRKRSHSSTRAEEIYANILDISSPPRRSKSPNNLDELSAVSGSMCGRKRRSNSSDGRVSPDSCSSLDGAPKRTSTKLLSPTDSSSSLMRKYMSDIKSPGDSGKYSLPGYGLISTIKCASPVNSDHLKIRSPSECSSSSEFSHKDGKLPLKATVREVSWGSTKLRSIAHKTIQIKNMANKRLVLRVEITGPGFQISNPIEQGNRITLQPQECRSMLLSFCPTVIGTAVGRLSFYPPLDVASEASAYISLYGYGGHAFVVPHNILKGPVGAPFIFLGELKHLNRPQEKTFSLYNRGVLPAFATIIIDAPDTDLPSISDCIHVTPKKILIPPESTREIKVVFKPRREDLRRLVKKLAPVMIVGKLKVICGDEPTRQRIRNLIKRMNDDQSPDITPPALKTLWKSFPSENSIHELALLREQSAVAMELVSTLKTHDILLTVNHTSMEDTAESSFWFSDMDDTLMFKTMVAESTMVEAVAKTSYKMKMPPLTIVPKTLELSPSDRKKKSVIRLRCNSSQDQFYEMASNCTGLIAFTPKEGQLSPGQETQIIVDIKSIDSLPSDEAKIYVYLENERMEIPITMVREKHRSQRS